MFVSGLICLNELLNCVTSHSRVPAHWGLGEIDGLLVSQGKASD